MGDHRDLKKGGTTLFPWHAGEIEFWPTQKNFTCEALVVVALKKKKNSRHLTIFSRLLQEIIQNSVKTLLIFIINNTIYK